MFLGDGKLCQPNNPNDIFLRPTRTGDICILLEPCDREELDRLRLRQNSLVKLFGGQRAEVIHLTCQRFESHHEQQLSVLKTNLYQNRSAILPFPITAISFSSLHESYRDTNILKWCVQVTDELMGFLKYIEHSLLESSITPLYKPSFIPTLVTALVNIPDLDLGEDLGEFTFPQHLFHAQQLQLSKICAPGEFEILGTVEFSNS